MNEILLRRKRKVFILPKEESSENNRNYVATINKNIENLGYTFSNELFNTLSTYSREELGSFYIELITVLKNMKGAHVVYKPMYPNFPKQVMEMSDVELYINAIVHYWSRGTLLPASQRSERLPFFDEGKIEVLELGSAEDIKNLFIGLVSSKTSLSQTDKDDIAWFFKEMPYLKRYLPDKLEHKENIAHLCKLDLEDKGADGVTLCYKYLRTATDVLRFAAALSYGDISLAENTRFRNFRRNERRLILRLLENCGKAREEDMLRYANRWIRLGEKLHPSERRMVHEFPNAEKAFKKLRENEKISTFNNVLEAAITAKEWEKVIKLLSTRPGEFARRLDFLLRNCDENLVTNQFHAISTKISTPVLLQVREHFLHRSDDQHYRVFFPKGSLARSYNIPNELPEINESICGLIVGICESALISQYRERSCMGKVYLSEKYKNYIVPFSQRSASKSLKTVVRGSRLPINENAKAVRGFIWWTNAEGRRIDIDLSAAIFDENWRYMEHISYTRLRSERYKACHSGDITNGGPENGNGVAEFLDVDIDSVIQYGARYIVYQVYDFTEIGFKRLPNAMFGWMERADVSSGEIFEPKTVTQKMDLTADSCSCVPVIFDCLTREFIWCDMSLYLNNLWGGNNVESNLNTVEATCYAVANMQKPNLYDLIHLNVCARGVLVANKDEADVIFDIEDGITPFDTEIFMSEFL